MARGTQQRYTDEDFESLDGRASRTEQKKAVQRMAALGEQLAQLNPKQIQKLPVDERLIDALLEVQNISAHEARRRQFLRIGKLLRNEDETTIFINEFSKIYNASERHTLRQHVLRIHRDIKQQVSEEQLVVSKLKFVNYVQQVALLSDQG